MHFLTKDRSLIGVAFGRYVNSFHALEVELFFDDDSIEFDGTFFHVSYEKRMDQRATFEGASEVFQDLKIFSKIVGKDRESRDPQVYDRCEKLLKTWDEIGGYYRWKRNGSPL